MSKNVTNSICPTCGYEVDSASAVDGTAAQPSVGDYTICLRCSCPLKFGYDFQLERLTAAELVSFKKAFKKAAQKGRKNH